MFELHVLHSSMYCNPYHYDHCSCKQIDYTIGLVHVYKVQYNVHWKAKVTLEFFKVQMGEFKYHNDSIPQTLKSKEY